jgi:hypothetical protein
LATEYPESNRDSGASEPASGVYSGPVGSGTYAQLIGRAINDLSDLVDRQIELARQEFKENLDEVLGGVKLLAFAAGIGAALGLLAVIWLWTAFIWFFNWLGETLLGPYIGVFGGLLGWLLSLAVMGAAGWYAYKLFRRGFREVRISPMARTRQTLKEDLEWVKQLRTPSAK